MENFLIAQIILLIMLLICYDKVMKSCANTHEYALHNTATLWCTSVCICVCRDSQSNF